MITHFSSIDSPTTASLFSQPAAGRMSRAIHYSGLRGLPRRISTRDSDAFTSDGSNQTRPALRANGIARLLVWLRSHRIVGRLESSHSNSSNFAPETSFVIACALIVGLAGRTGTLFASRSEGSVVEEDRFRSFIILFWNYDTLPDIRHPRFGRPNRTFNSRKFTEDFAAQ
jgi:hypothetical protein